MKKILEKIESYQNIVIYRHINPDYDAFGSQFGLYDILKTTFVNKNIYLAGNFDSDLVEKYDFKVFDPLPDFSIPTLAIVLDTANRERIDGESFLNCKEVIKIDHHIVVDHYGTLHFEDPSASSASELVVRLFEMFEDKLTISKKGASALYMGIVGDTNRFLYSSTTSKTFQAVQKLLEYDIDLSSIYQKMYVRSKKELEVEKYILNHYQERNGIAYYILMDDDLCKLQLSRQRGSDFVTLLSQIEEYKIWFAITENKTEGNFRVSIRSRDIPINDVANKFHGGGHVFASGATLKSLDELDDLIQCLKEKL